MHSLLSQITAREADIQAIDLRINRQSEKLQAAQKRKEELQETFNTEWKTIQEEKIELQSSLINKKSQLEQGFKRLEQLEFEKRII